MTHPSPQFSSQQNGLDCSTLNPHVRAATQEDVLDLAGRLRQSDLKEIDLSSGLEPLEAIQAGFDSGTCWVLTYEGSPEVIYGVVPHPQMKEYGVIWMLASDNISKFKTEFIKTSAEVIDHWLEQYEVLFNYVHSENVISKKWLKYTGFKIHPEQPYGLYGANFNLFTRNR